MAAAGRFLLGIESPVGASLAPSHDSRRSRERETVERLLEEEIARTIEGRPSSRAEFLSRFARIVHQHDSGKPAPASAAAASKAAPITEIKPSARPPAATPAPAPEPTSSPAPDPVEVTAPGAAIAAALSGMALTQGLSPAKPDKPTAGFAELLFQGESELAPPDEPDWARRPNAGRALPSALDPASDPTPIWLKAAVFLLGSMAVGGFFAHLSGDALWQKGRPTAATATRSPATATSPAAGPAENADLQKLSPAQQAPAPPPDATAPGVTLRPPPAASLKSQLEN